MSLALGFRHTREASGAVVDDDDSISPNGFHRTRGVNTVVADEGDSDSRPGFRHTRGESAITADRTDRNEFRRTQGSSAAGNDVDSGIRTGFRRISGASDSVADRVLTELHHGSTPRLAAQRLGLPLDLVSLVVEREQAAGRLEVVQVTRDRCIGSCDPDPDSLVCAGCPVLPLALRRN